MLGSSSLHFDLSRSFGGAFNDRPVVDRRSYRAAPSAAVMRALTSSHARVPGVTGALGPEIVRWREAEAGLCRGAAAEHASASGKVGPVRQPTAKERRDMVIEEKEFEPKG